jgi:hypothetical protein
VIVDLENAEVIFDPFPKQQLAIECPAFELMYGGSKGCAKTHYLVGCVLPLLQMAHDKFVATGRKQKRCRIVVFRKNIKDLNDIIVKMFEIYPRFDRAMGEAGFHTNEKYWTFTSGATVELYHLDGPESHRGFNGQELVAVLFDELQFISFDAYRFLVAQCRSSDPDYDRMRMIRGTANPGGEDWLINYFHINECPEGGRVFEHVEEIDGVEYTTTRAYIRARPRDNPALPPSYWAQLKSTMNEDEQAMFIEGDWFRVAGAYLSKFIRPEKHFARSTPIPDGWEMRFGLDWGSTNPACLLVAARDNDGRIWIIDELHKPGVTGRKFGEDMADVWKRQKWCSDRLYKVDDFYGVIDKQAMDRYGSESTAAAGIQEWGFRVFPAEKDRTAGCNQIKERFLLDRLGNPQVIVFEDRCPNLKRALTGIDSDAPRAPDEYNPDSAHAHAMDALRFIFMTWPLTNVRRDDPLDAEVARWTRILAAQPAPTHDTGRMTSGYGD